MAGSPRIIARPRDGDGNMRSGRKNARGAARTKNGMTKGRQKWRDAPLTKKAPYKPDAGDRHVRFDERGWETGRCRMAQVTAPILDSTLTTRRTSVAICRFRGATDMSARGSGSVGCQKGAGSHFARRGRSICWSLVALRLPDQRGCARRLDLQDGRSVAAQEHGHAAGLRPGRRDFQAPCRGRLAVRSLLPHLLRARSNRLGFRRRSRYLRRMSPRLRSRPLAGIIEPCLPRPADVEIEIEDAIVRSGIRLECHVANEVGTEQRDERAAAGRKPGQPQWPIRLRAGWDTTRIELLALAVLDASIPFVQHGDLGCCEAVVAPPALHCRLAGLNWHLRGSCDAALRASQTREARRNVVAEQCLLCGWRVANTIPVLEEGNGRTDTLRERRSVDYDWLADVALGHFRPRRRTLPRGPLPLRPES
jgi:hypothetical protein